MCGNGGDGPAIYEIWCHDVGRVNRGSGVLDTFAYGCVTPIVIHALSEFLLGMLISTWNHCVTARRCKNHLSFTMQYNREQCDGKSMSAVSRVWPWTFPDVCRQQGSRRIYM